MARNQRMDRALDPPKRGIWIATGLVMAGGLLVLLWAVSPAELGRRRALEALELGDTTARVVAYLGEAPARCPIASLAHLRETFPPGWPAASVNRAVQALETRTRERWVYPLSSRSAAGCQPRDGQTEIGVSAAGRVLWYVAVTGKTPLRLPDEISPAQPEGVASAR